VSELVERLREACKGHPHAKIPWPHRLLHEAIAEIERLSHPSPSEDVAQLGRETVANWMILRGYATGHGDSIQDMLFEMEGQLGGPREPPPGEGDFKLLEARALAAESAAARLREALEAAKRALMEARNDIDHISEAGNVNPDHAFERIDTAIAALIGTGDGWREIESAPKNKTNVFVCREGAPHGFTAAWFDQWPYDDSAPEAATEGGWVLPGGKVLRLPPTHWRLMPSPPSGRETTGDA
jgi:hypothetical protein